MAGRAVAKSGDVSPTNGTGMFTDPHTMVTAASGNWTAGPVTETSYPFLTIGGAAVLHEATCTFAFAGYDSSNNAMAGTSDVDLVKGPTTLQKSSTFVLRDTDSKSDGYGNTLSLSAPNNLTSD
jgi:hypothetical protein